MVNIKMHMYIKYKSRKSPELPEDFHTYIKL